MSAAEDQIAAAIVAKMAGETLNMVDQNTLTQSSSGPATKMDPRSFLPGNQQRQQHQQDELTVQANQMAERMHPLPEQQQQLPLPVAAQPTTQITSPVVQVPETEPVDPNQLTFDFFNDETVKKSFKQLDIVIDYLYSINNKLDRLIKQETTKEKTSDKHTDIY